MKKLLATLITILVIPLTGIHAFAQSAPEAVFLFKDVTVFYEYGKEIIFQTTLQTEEEVKEIFLFIQPQGQNVRTETVTGSENGEVIFTYDAAAAPLRPFAVTDYWFQATLTDDNIIESEKHQFLYEDNRFDWQRLEKNGFQINWHHKDASFGQTVLGVAQQSLEVSRNYVPAEPPDILRIYVYENASDVQIAMNLGQHKSWVAGHASPDLATVLVSVPQGPGEKLELERQIPHEITHIMQYQLMGANYRNAPLWLLEGTASLAELYPNPDYERVLERAVENQSLIKIEDLCNTFPQEASRAFLAYAQSESFTRYIYTHHGSSGLQTLMMNYENGLGCSEGFSAAFKTSLTQEEYNWQQQLGIHTGSLILQNIAPYFLVLALITLPVSIGSIRKKERTQ
ncbi:MAG: peptidase MA family metallohydrolase [Anaerolineaceae bacterium]|jgi:hypothetical protein|nr:peptidase MA family metallohydrolase [Anaerolineaceae bacterium]